MCGEGEKNRLKAESEDRKIHTLFGGYSDVTRIASLFHLFSVSPRV